MYQALYRKYRPKTFDEVVGQKSVTDTLAGPTADGASEPCVPLHRHPGHGQDELRQDPGQGRQLPGADRRQPLQPLRHLQGHRSRGLYGRAGDRRGVKQRRRPCPALCGMTRSIPRQRQKSGCISSTRSICSRCRRSTPCSRRSRSRRSICCLSWRRRSCTRSRRRSSPAASAFPSGGCCRRISPGASVMLPTRSRSPLTMARCSC